MIDAFWNVQNLNILHILDITYSTLHSELLTVVQSPVIYDKQEFHKLEWATFSPLPSFSHIRITTTNKAHKIWEKYLSFDLALPLFSSIIFSSVLLQEGKFSTWLQ